jgi:putative peptidoglycan lipid II flippase
VTEQPDDTAESPGAGARRSSARSSIVVGAGILLSRITGLVRERALATYFGTGLHADVFSAGLRMPNILQNLLGEGTLSAAFIPVYSELLAAGRTREAGRVAGAMFALLLAIAGLVSVLGIALAPLIVSVFTPGFTGARRELLIAVVRIIFPMTGILVLSAWALAILNSHRKFFVPYFAPVLWNAAIVASLVAFSARVGLDGLLMAAAWGALAGGALQLAVQIPFVLRMDRQIRINSGRRERSFIEILRNAGPAIMGRGVVQLSSYMDLMLASLLAIGAPARLRYAQTLYLLPISVFGMSVAAAELPDLARERGQATTALRERTAAAVRRVSFFVLPSFAAFLALGDVLVAGLYESGQFDAGDVAIVWCTLAAYSLGLPASTTSRVYQSAFFALRDTRTPARVAAVRIAVGAVCGSVLMLQFETVTIAGFSIGGGLFGDARVGGAPLGPVGLAAGAALGAWCEWLLLRARLVRLIGSPGPHMASLGRMLAAALAGAAAGYGVRLVFVGASALWLAVLVAAAFGVVYFAVARSLGLDEARTILDSLLGRIRRLVRAS